MTIQKYTDRDDEMVSTLTLILLLDFYYTFFFHTMDNPFHPANEGLISSARRDLLMCPICLSKEGVSIIPPVLDEPWVMTLKCKNDISHGTWSTCLQCDCSSRVRYNNRKSLQRHKYRHHRKKKEEIINVNNDLGSPSFPYETNFMDEIPRCLEPEVTFDCFSNSSSREYFRSEYTTDTGWKSLVSKAFFQNTAPATSISDDDAQLVTYFVRLAMVMSREERDIFSRFLLILSDRQRVVCSNRFTIQLVHCAEDIRKIVFKGANSILENIPIPQPTLIGEYSYVSLHDIVADFLGHGYPYDEIPETSEVINEVTTLSSSKVVSRVKERAMRREKGGRDMPLVILYLVEWSDSFEPNVIKDNRGSVWIKTVTISPKHIGGVGSKHNTYPLCLGPAKVGDRTLVNQKFRDELSSFKEGPLKEFYCGRRKKVCQVHLELVACIQDQPERRGENCIALGNSTFSSRWGYAIDSKSVISRMVPCPTCNNIILSKRIDLESKLDDCTECISWNYDDCNLRQQKMLKVDRDLCHPYPDKIGDKPISDIFPRKLTFQQLDQAVTTSHNHMVDGKWTKSETQSYLKSYGINTSAIEAITECAQNCHAIKNLDGSNDNDQMVLLAHQRQREQFPSQYKICKPPTSWRRGLEMWQHVEAIMHLVFHGIQKTNQQRVELWCARKGNQTAFRTFACTILDQVQSLNLEWCKCCPYKGNKFGGWVGENYLAMARLSPWFYSMLDKFDIVQPYDGDPTSDPSKWTKKQNSAWLRARGLHFSSKDNAASLKLKVKDYMELETIPPILEPPTVDGKEVQQFLYSATEMIALIMTRRVTRIYLEKLRWSIRVFLSHFHKIDSTIRDHNNKSPSWVTSYNYLCLLNLPKMAEEFGPLRNLWEGGYIGEGFLRLVKPRINQGHFGMRKNWEINLHRSILNEKFLSWKGAQSNIRPQKPQVRKYTHRYDLRESVVSDLRMQMVLSCCYLRGGTFCFLLGNGEGIPFTVGELVSTINSLHYFNIILELESDIIIQEKDVDSHCLLLPGLTPRGMPNVAAGETTGYTIIDSEWRKINERGNSMVAF